MSGLSVIQISPKRQFCGKFHLDLLPSPPEWPTRGINNRRTFVIVGGFTGSRGEREFFIDNILVRIHFIIDMIWWTGLAPWELEFPFPGSLTSTFLSPCCNERPRIHSNPKLRLTCRHRSCHMHAPPHVSAAADGVPTHAGRVGIHHTVE